MTAAPDDLEALRGMSLDALRALWAERIGPPPKLRSKDLLARMLAFRLQAEAEGGLTAETLSLLRRGPKAAPSGLDLGEGAVLRKIFRGRTYEVTVLKDGFLHDGERYSNLTAVATAITGTRWNGPRFFGLRDGGAS